MRAAGGVSDVSDRKEGSEIACSNATAAAIAAARAPCPIHDNEIQAAGGGSSPALATSCKDDRVLTFNWMRARHYRAVLFAGLAGDAEWQHRQQELGYRTQL